MDMYILNSEGEPVRCHDYDVYGAWMQENYRLRLTESEGCRVSTVFLGLVHRFDNTSEPILWETMVFGGPHDQHQERYTSQAEAIAGHDRVVQMVSTETPEDER